MGYRNIRVAAAVDAKYKIADRFTDAITKYDVWCQLLGLAQFRPKAKLSKMPEATISFKSDSQTYSNKV